MKAIKKALNAIGRAIDAVLGVNQTTADLAAGQFPPLRYGW